MFVLQSKTTEGSRNRKVSFSKWNVIVAQSWESLVFLLAQMEEPDPHHPFVLSRDKKKKKKIPAVRRIAGELHVPLQDGSTTTKKKSTASNS